MKVLVVLAAAVAVLVSAAPAPAPVYLAPLVYGSSPPEAYAAAAGYAPSVHFRPSLYGSQWGYGYPYGGYGNSFSYGHLY